MRDLVVLKWTERALLAAALALAMWYAAVLVRSHLADRMRPPLIITEQLPEESAAAEGTSGHAPCPGGSGPGRAISASPAAPAPGTWVARIQAPTLKLSATVLEGTDDATMNRAAGHIEDTPLPGMIYLPDPLRLIRPTSAIAS
jgi:hypothetical protein